MFRRSHPRQIILLFVQMLFQNEGSELYLFKNVPIKDLENVHGGKEL